MKLGLFSKNEEFGKTRVQLTEEIAEVTVETRKRTVNGLTTEDQQWRESYLREARGAIN